MRRTSSTPLATVALPGVITVVESQGLRLEQE
jgi:hypothetical protein